MDPILHPAHFDSALQSSVLNDPQPWPPVRLWLEFLKTFRTFTPEWRNGASADNGAREHLTDLPKHIEIEFKNTGKERDSEDAVKNGDLEKMEIYKPKIGDAYTFLSGYVFQNNALSDALLRDKRWFPSYSSLLGNCHCLNRDSPLYDEFESILKFLEKLQLPHIMFTESKKFRDMCVQHGGVAICLAGLLFSCWAEEGEYETSLVKAKLSDLLQKIKPTTLGILAQYLEVVKSQIHSLQEKLMVELLGITLLVLKGSLKPNPPPETDCLLFLIRHLVDSPGKEDGEIGRILCNVASDPGSLGQLLQEAELLRVKILLTELGDRESIRERPRFDDAYSENMMQILEEMETLMISGAEAKPFNMGRGPDPFIKVSLDFYIAVFQAFLMELVSHSSILVLAVKVQVQNLSKESKRFRRYSSILPLKNPADMKPVSNLMVLASREADNLHKFLLSTRVVEENMSELSMFLSEFLEQLRNLNEKVEEIYLRFRDSSMVSFPKTLPGISFVDFFLERLRGMANKAFPDGYCINSQIGAVLQGKNSLAEVLKTVREKQNNNQELTDLKRRVTQAAYEADYIIDSILMLDADTCHLLWLSDAVNEMNLVKSDLIKLRGMNNTHLLRVQGAVKKLDAGESEQSTPEVGEYIVPLDDQVSKVIELLTKGDKFMVGVVGTPGIGKTTLATTVYGRVKHKFEKHAQCIISQEFRTRDVLLKILKEIDPKLVENLQESDDEDALRLKLFKDLNKGKNFLIFMDDIWSEAAWNILEKGIPKPRNGSRILFTSRKKNVLYTNYKDSVDVYHPMPLNPEESWNLLQRRVFGENLKCPEGLKIVGREIAIRCKGIPLALVTVSGLLRKKEQEMHVWNEIKQHLSSRISAESQCNRILELSYNHLPDHLKPCLLYFAIFREDQEIQVSRLIRLWTSEGLIRQAEPELELELELDLDPKPKPKPEPDSNKVVGSDKVYIAGQEESDDDDEAEVKVKTLEDVALDYLEDLASRSLIMASRRSEGSTKKMKVCKIHDLLHHLCQTTAKKNNFFESMTKYHELYPSKPVDHGPDIDPNEGTTPPSYLDKHRLRIVSKRNQFVRLQPSGQAVRTLLFSATPDGRPTCPYDVSFIPLKFKILKVLDIESINMDSSFPEKILDLDPLRYLAVGGDIVSIPPAIERLWNLEDFTVRGLKGRVKLPSTIWSMSKLRHLHVYPGLTFENFGDDDDHGKKDPRQLQNLSTLSSPALSKWGEDLEAIVKKAPQLRRLKCTFSPTLHSTDCFKFKHPKELLKLESLKVLYTGQSPEPWELTFPSRLNKLSLKSFSLTVKCMSSIGKLPRLQVLTLVSMSFEDSKWEMGEDHGFPKLRTLKLDSSDLQDWVVPSDNFGHLERLVVCNCKNLRELPSGFAMMDMLREIELMQCSAITDASLAEFLRDQRGYSGTGALAITSNGNGIKI